MGSSRRRVEALLVTSLLVAPCPLARAAEVHGPADDFRMTVGGKPDTNECIVIPQAQTDAKACEGFDADTLRKQMSGDTGAGKIISVVRIGTGPTAHMAVVLYFEESEKAPTEAELSAHAKEFEKGFTASLGMKGDLLDSGAHSELSRVGEVPVVRVEFEIATSINAQNQHVHVIAGELFSHTSRYALMLIGTGSPDAVAAMQETATSALASIHTTVPPSVAPSEKASRVGETVGVAIRWALVPFGLAALTFLYLRRKNAEKPSAPKK